MISAWERHANYLILVVFSLFILWPLGLILTQALSPGPGQSGIQPGNFTEAWTVGHFDTYMLNSVQVTVVTVAVAVAVSVLAGYAFGTMSFVGSTPLFYLFLLGIMVPTEAIIIPLYFDLRAMGLTDTILAVSAPQIAMSTAFGTYWMRTYFRSANRSVAEAARMDGAGTLRSLWSIQLPIARPALITLIVLLFMWTWNEFLIPLIMSPTGAMRTAPLGLAFFQGQHVTDTQLLAAGAVIVAFPVVAVYLFLQRHFIRGMLEGAVKD